MIPKTIPSSWQNSCSMHYWKYSLPELQHRSLKILEENSVFIIDLEPISIVHYTRPGSSIKQPPELRIFPTPCKVACFYPESSSKISLPLCIVFGKPTVLTYIHTPNLEMLSHWNMPWQTLVMIVCWYAMMGGSSDEMPWTPGDTEPELWGAIRPYTTLCSLRLRQFMRNIPAVRSWRVSVCGTTHGL